MSTQTTDRYLSADMSSPRASSDGLDTEFWNAARGHQLLETRCIACRTFEFAPGWLCRGCHPFDLVPIENPDADNARIAGNLLGDAHQTVSNGDELDAVFVDPDDDYALVQSRTVTRSIADGHGH